MWKSEGHHACPKQHSHLCAWMATCVSYKCHMLAALLGQLFLPTAKQSVSALATRKVPYTAPHPELIVTIVFSTRAWYVHQNASICSMFMGTPAWTHHKLLNYVYATRPTSKHTHKHFRISSRLVRLCSPLVLMLIWSGWTFGLWQRTRVPLKCAYTKRACSMLLFPSSSTKTSTRDLYRRLRPLRYCVSQTLSQRIFLVLRKSHIEKPASLLRSDTNIVADTTIEMIKLISANSSYLMSSYHPDISSHEQIFLRTGKTRFWKQIFQNKSYK